MNSKSLLSLREILYILEALVDAGQRKISFLCMSQFATKVRLRFRPSSVSATSSRAVVERQVTVLS